MAPIRPKTRTSDAAAGPSTPSHRSPIKKRKAITLQQKQALIDNLQLEITERARRLRAQYHLQAQGLKSRIEIRVNRIPISLRKVKMEDLLLKYSEQKSVLSAKGPPVPAKDTPVRMSPQKPSHTAGQSRQISRPQKRLSHEISGNKENQGGNGENPKKKTRVVQGQDAPPSRPAILSPTSSNSRLTNYQRITSPAKTQIARPASPIKQTRTAAATSMLSNFVEKAKSTRAAGARKLTAATNPGSTANSAPAAAGRARRTVAPAAAKAPTSRPATRTGYRGSEASEGSTSTVVKKRPASRATGTTTAASKKAVAKTVDARKAATKPAATPLATTATGRVLRKRG